VLLGFTSQPVATSPRTLAQHGVLQGYESDSYSARKLGLQTTGHAGGAAGLWGKERRDPLPGDLLRAHLFYQVKLIVAATLWVSSEPASSPA